MRSITNTLILAAALALPAMGVPAFVRGASAASTGGTTIAASFGSLPTVGRLVVVGCGEDTNNNANLAGPALTVSDNQAGNVYTKVSPFAWGGSSGTWVQMFYTIVVGSSGTYTVTCGTNTSGRITVAIAEYSGIQTTRPLDQWAPSTIFTGTTADVSYAVTPQTANQVLVAVAYSRITSGTWTAGANFNIETNVTPGGGHATIALEDRIVNSIASYSSPITTPGANSAVIMLATFSGDTYPTTGLVQSSINATTSGSSIAATFNQQPTIGNTVVVACGSSDGGTPTFTVSDNQASGGNTYSTAHARDGAANGWQQIFYAPITKSSGTFTVTCSEGSAVRFNALIYEFTTVSTSNITTTQTSGTGTTLTTSGLTAAAANSLYVGCAYVAASGLLTISAGTGYSMQASLDGVIGTNTINIHTCQFAVFNSGSQTAAVNISGANAKILDLVDFNGVNAVVPRRLLLF